MAYDFTRVRAKLVPSVAGKHRGWPNVIRTGHTTLMKALREIGAEAGTSRRVMVEYQVRARTCSPSILHPVEPLGRSGSLHFSVPGLCTDEVFMLCPSIADRVPATQGSSIGMYSTQWVNEFYGSASGESPEKWLDEPKSRRAKLPWPPVKILFPTRAWVQGSVLGEKVRFFRGSSRKCI